MAEQPVGKFARAGGFEEANGAVLARRRGGTGFGMNYTDPAFPIFFTLFFLSYYALRSSAMQIGALVAASLVFYAWNAPLLVVLLLFTWFVTCTTSYIVLKSKFQSNRRRIATLGVIINLLILAIFKYKSLIPSSYYEGSSFSFFVLLPLPIGISFYTFHGISLLVDVYRGRALSSRFSEHTSRSEYAVVSLLYLVFFPQLIAGPIVKAKDFIPQIGYKRFADIPWLKATNTLITGFFLKMVIADNLSAVTFWIQYPYFQWKSSLELTALLYGYSFQIFADFAGYSLIAIGLASLLGYKLPDNFNFPYASKSISDFWRRWHISLSSWLRDYLYIPLGGNRHGASRTNFNLLMVMVLGGLWHGAAWSFALWGLWHGIGLVVERPFLARTSRFAASKIGKMLRVVLVFNFVTLGWLFFKLQNSNEALLYLRTMFSANPYPTSTLTLLLIVIFGFPVVAYHVLATTRLRLSNRVAQVTKGTMLFLAVTSAGPAVEFIYFQF